MARVISLTMLVLVTSILLALFYKVVSVFLLPLFLAVVAVLLLRPLQVRAVKWCGNRRYLAAMLMTFGVLLAVLIPVLTVVVIAGSEAVALIKAVDNNSLRIQLNRMRNAVGLDYPFAEEFRYLDSSMDALRRDASLGATAVGNPGALNHIQREFERLAIAISDQSHSITIPDSNPVSTALLAAGQAEIGSLEYQRALAVAAEAIRSYRTTIAGGEWKLPLKEMANPSHEDLRRLVSHFSSVTTGNIASIGGVMSVIAARTGFSLLIFVMALFFWFADGPEIIRALMTLSPLEDRYEEQLLIEFEVLVRAVVIGSIASAVAQALLSGIAFWIIGLKPVILLTVVTAVMAMVPFVGASLVWLPVSAWLAFAEGRLTAGVGLAIYGAVVISTIDNIIRPWIIMEKASLHPLAALVGVLGGVQALGPVGVFVGPIVVAFLQTILTLLHREFSEPRVESENKATELRI